MSRDDRPRTERIRVADALLAARDSLTRAEERLANDPSAKNREAVASAKRTVEVLERRTVQVND
jgi:hypothetical protein